MGTLINKNKRSKEKTDYSQNTESRKINQWYTETRTGSFSESSFWNDIIFFYVQFKFYYIKVEI